MRFDEERARRCTEMAPDERIIEDYDSAASDYAWAGDGHAQALAQQAQAEHELELLEAVLREDAIEALNDRHDKVTVDAIRAEVVKEKTHAAGVDRVIQCKLASARWKACANAIKLKSEMLISKGAHLRKEIEGAV